MAEGTVLGGNILVLGGTGFIGATLSNRLADLSYRVRAFGRAPSEHLNHKVEFYRGDFSNPADVEGALHGQDIVFHLVQGTPPSLVDADIAGDLQRTVFPTLSLLQQCLKSHAKRVIFVSSGGTVYGEPVGHVLHEESTTSPISGYGAHKLLIENYLHIFHQNHAMDCRVARLSNPYGPHQDPQKGVGLIAAVATAIAAGQPISIFGTGQNERDYLYISDAIDALLKLMSYEGDHRLFNVGSGIGRSILDIIAAVEAVSGLTAKRNFLPTRPFDVSRNVLDVGLAKRELAWRPTTPLLEGIALTLRQNQHATEGAHAKV
ncbi:NAD-dependent epimerase/dehydratase family protein [Mesorhizobium sp. NBSH29]|uniref:NAD-dependent epimerase/dehydratase family protein n=1 Tax=Mesorhizobium sp. NBSH29 TaxID=2654249 RepID=UPI00189649DF|nr:NAD-dependent epimerase/dehydratase family protein [Mesorhizobium sp. NBSH29]QPC87441.1 NAD-dependent epimerase/dehydratase family protein [Mesorhizobium sp. NBSH29]